MSVWIASACHTEWPNAIHTGHSVCGMAFTCGKIANTNPGLDQAEGRMKVLAAPTCFWLLLLDFVCAYWALLKFPEGGKFASLQIIRVFFLELCVYIYMCIYIYTYIYVCIYKCVKVSHSVVSDSLRLWGLYSPWNSSGQNTGVGSLPFPSPGIFTTQGSNPGLPHCRQILYELSHQGSPIYVCMCIYIDIHTHDFEVNYWWEILIYPNF